MEIKSKSEYRLLSYIRDNPGIEGNILKMLNVTALNIGWEPRIRKIYDNAAKNGLMTINERKCFLTEEGREALEAYEKIHALGKRGIIEHKHESERIRFVR